MGLCLSKKQHRRQEEQPSNAANKSGKRAAGKDAAAALVAEAKKAPQAKPAPSRKATPLRAEETAADKRTVFVVKAAAAAAAAEVAAEANGAERAPAALAEEAKPAVVSRVPVRTSSCTKEEVDAILIQCGRLSRSSSASGKTAGSGESGGGHQRRYSGSKRSYDFDRERRGGGVDDELDWERHGGGGASRPSPRRRTPERKRSASHEARSGGGSGSRRVSRSPGRRGDGAAAAVSSVGAERAARQPGKMVSVPAREKGRAPSPVKSAPEKGRAPSPVKSAPSGKRYASPTLRSNSPARAAAVANENAGAQATHGPSLSRSSSRKADHSPYRRNPMSELDENTLVSNHHTTNNGNKSQKKPIESVAAVSHKLGITKDKPEIVEGAVASDTKAPSGRMNATHTMSIVAESAVNPRDGPGGRSWRRSSRDFDLEGAMASDNRAPSSKINATHSVNIVAESVANPKAGPLGRSSRRSSRDFDHNGSSVAFLNEAMASDTKAPSSRMNATHTVSIVSESVAHPKAGPAGRSSRRSSRDFDHNGNSYASLLLEDIQSYHQQNTSDTAAVAPAFSLPACVSKACSILEAVADLNSSSEDRSFELDRSADDKGSVNVSYNGKSPVAAGTHVVESEVVVKDDLMEPSLHKYVSVRDIRGEIEPLESAGSNSFAGNPWTCSWEPNSVDSTARTWTSSQSNGDDDVEQHSSGTVSANALDQSWQSKQETGGHPQVGSARYSQLGGHRGSIVLSAQSDVRTVSVSSSIA